MNYTCVCVGGFLIIELLWWAVAGRAYSESMQKAREDDANAARLAVVVVDSASTNSKHKHVRHV